MKKNALIMCYGKHPYTCGRFLEDAFRRLGVEVTLFTGPVDFSKVALKNYQGVLFVESPTRPIDTVKNIHLVRIPKIFWITHGAHRWKKNMELCKIYQPDLLLMAHSLHLGKNLSLPVRFFPFAVDAEIFNSTSPLQEREISIGFAGSRNPRFYLKRNSSLNRLKEAFGKKGKVSFTNHKFLKELAAFYGDCKIVFNQTADVHRSINMRIFEGMGCGALVITDQVPGEEILFKNEKHLVIFRKQKDLLDQAAYYLNHLSQAQAIASEGQKLVLAKHTYERRAKEILHLLTK